MIRFNRYLVAGITAVLIVGLMSLRGLNNIPYLWISIFLALFLIACGIVSAARQTWLKIIWINIAAIIFALAAAEIGFTWQQPARPAERYSGDYTQNYFSDHPLLGFGPIADQQVRSQRFIDDALVYDVVYTINEHGLRATPQSPEGIAQFSVLFFGGSVTFGEGVSDAESMPYVVGTSIPAIYQTYNFGFHGYGPHQMLAELEHGLTEEIITTPASDIIYQAIPAHVARVAGLAHWDRNGPMYELRADQTVVYRGSFADGRNWMMNWLLPWLQKSLIYQKIFGLQRTLTADDIDLYVAVVAAARDESQRLYPNSRFHVLLWGYKGDGIFDAIHAGLLKKGITPYLISDILPEYGTAPEKYQIAEYETHPNAQAHRLIAQYVSKQILADKPAP